MKIDREFDEFKNCIQKIEYYYNHQNEFPEFIILDGYKNNLLQMSEFTKRLENEIDSIVENKSYRLFSRNLRGVRNAIAHEYVAIEDSSVLRAGNEIAKGKFNFIFDYIENKILNNKNFLDDLEENIFEI